MASLKSLYCLALQLQSRLTSPGQTENWIPIGKRVSLAHLVGESSQQTSSTVASSGHQSSEKCFHVSPEFPHKQGVFELSRLQAQPFEAGFLSRRWRWLQQGNKSLNIKEPHGLGAFMTVCNLQSFETCQITSSALIFAQLHPEKCSKWHERDVHNSFRSISWPGHINCSHPYVF